MTPLRGFLPPAAVLAAMAFLMSAPGRADSPSFSGLLSVSAAGSAGAGGAEPFSAGLESYGSLRLKAPAGDRATVYAALNLTAVARPYHPGMYYESAVELERLYVRIEGEALDLEAGLLRLSLGYGPAWRPMDFLAPPNPMIQDARPRGILGAVVTVYPSRTARLKAFAAAGADPEKTGGEGATLGLAADIHGNLGSLQGLYAFRTPEAGHSLGRHFAGVSAKLEAGASFILDVLYELDPDSNPGLSGLKASVGADYSFLGGDLYVLGQYLFNGSGALAPEDDLASLYGPASEPWYEIAPEDREIAAQEVAELNRRNYLYAAVHYRIDDFTRISFSCAVSLDDLSFLPALVVELEPFQALTLSVSCRVPLDRHSLGRLGARGELGPDNAGSRASMTVSARLRF